MTITLEGYISDFVTEAASICNCTPQQVIENILYGCIAERSATQELFPDDPGKAMIQELAFIDSKEGRRLKFIGEEVFTVIREEKLKELREISIMAGIVSALVDSGFSALPGGTA